VELAALPSEFQTVLDRSVKKTQKDDDGREAQEDRIKTRRQSEKSNELIYAAGRAT
jgi:hypothetical protein